MSNFKAAEEMLRQAEQLVDDIGVSADEYGFIDDALGSLWTKETQFGQQLQNYERAKQEIVTHIQRNYVTMDKALKLVAELANLKQKLATLE